MKTKVKSSVSKYLNLKKQVYQKGGAFQFKNPSMSGGLSAAGSLGSSLIDTIDPVDEYGQQSMAGAIGGNALKYAGMGAAFGPVGAGIGAVVGGTMGLLQNKQAEKRKVEGELQKSNLLQRKAKIESDSILANYNTEGSGITELANGGKITVSAPGMYAVDPLKFTRHKNTFKEGGTISTAGGKLKSIGESESFEVQGHNPNATDDVQVAGAYVDHAEVVKPTDEGLRIFSDTIKPPGSKLPFSKLAKQLEKQKTTDTSKFPEQNARIESKLNELFATQQLMNGNNQGESNAEALQPAGESLGAGFSQGEEESSMFRSGGLKNIVSKTGRYYHKITPEAVGMNPGNYFGAMVMNPDRDPQQVLSETVYKDNINFKIKGRYQKGGKLHMLAESEDDVKEAQLEKGIPIESKEHHVSLTKGKTIAGQHLKEDAKYYTKLAKIGLQKGGLKVTATEDFTVSPGNISTAMDNSLVVDDMGNPIPISKEGYVGPSPTSAFVKTDADPVFPTRSAHNAYWEKKAIASFSPEDAATYAQWGKQGSGAAYIAYKGGIPEWQAPVPTKTQIKSNPAPQKVDTSNIKHSKFKPVDPLHVYKSRGQMPRGFQEGGMNPWDLKAAADSGDYSQFTQEDVTDNLRTRYLVENDLKYRNALTKNNPFGIKPLGEMNPNSMKINTTANPGMRNKLNWSDGITTAATLAPVFSNMRLAKRLPAVATPNLNPAINLKKVNSAEQINALKQSQRVASLASQQNSVNPNAQAAGVAQAQAQFMQGANQAYGDVNRQNTMINNQESLYNSQIQGINNQKLDQYGQGQQARKANMLNLQSMNNSDLSNKILGMTASKNQQKLDLEKLKMQKGYYNLLGKGLIDRQQYLEADALKAQNNKKGGLIKGSTKKLSRKFA